MGVQGLQVQSMEQLLPMLAVAVEAVMTQIQHQRVELVEVVKGRKIQLAFHLLLVQQTQVVVEAVEVVVENPHLLAALALSSFATQAHLLMLQA
jgi:hypothetical protein